MRVGKDFLPHTAPSRSGQVLQTLVGAQESFAVGTVMVHVLQSVHTERDETAARDAPGRTKTATHRARYRLEQLGQWPPKRYIRLPNCRPLHQNFIWKLVFAGVIEDFKTGSSSISQASL